MIVLAVGLAIGALRFEFVYAGPVSEPTNVSWVIDYADLTPKDRELVQRAMGGERFVFENSGRLPGPGRGDIAIRYDGTWQVFTRRIFFDPSTTFGVASLVSGFIGVTCIVEAVRRQIRR